MRLTKQDNKTVILESRLFRTHYSRNSDVPVRLLNQPKLKKSRRIAACTQAQGKRSLINFTHAL